MKLKRILLSVALLCGIGTTAMADKGMWLLNELNQQNYERMKELGFKLSPEQLYSPGQPSVASAVVIFGGGCTGITVSNEGLIFTNHHCGFGAIQSQSTVDHDYLRDGFRSNNHAEELPIPGLSVRYLREIVDVTPRIEAAVKGAKSEMERLQIIEELSQKINAEYTKGSTIVGEVTPYYAGNKYYVVVYNVFQDVRLVMAPPSSVGKFGGDTDNWMWTRHTGDFSVFRVYADANNNPALYSQNNKPYKPISYAPVSLNGYREGDYAMTIGFPGSTNRYLTSWGVEDVINNENSPRIEVRGIKQAIWKEAMEADQATRIKYASKYAQSSNYWKNSIGMNRGLKNLDVVNRKRAEEKAFEAWIAKNNSQSTYGHILPGLKEDYAKSAAISKDINYLYETLWGGTEIVRLARDVNSVTRIQAADMPKYKARLDDLYKDYLPSLDVKVLPAMLNIVRQRVSADCQPDIFKFIDKKFKGSTEKYAQYVFEKSIVPYADKVKDFLSLPADKQKKVLDNDPAIALFNSVLPAILQAQGKAEDVMVNIEKGKREYFAASRIMDPNRQMPSDANFTMRMSYGSIKGYAPKDGVWYNYYTTEQGVFEKQDPTSSEFAVQPEILSLLRSKDFGQYGVGGHLRLCFLSDNDITGGNSGSPVFNGNGELIGLAFDGNWEAMSGDIEFEPDLQRTISVDIRYVLFMIDKWAKMPHLIKELNLVKGEPRDQMGAANGGNCPHKMAQSCAKKEECSKGKMNGDKSAACSSDKKDGKCSKEKKCGDKSAACSSDKKDGQCCKEKKCGDKSAACSSDKKDGKCCKEEKACAAGKKATEKKANCCSTMKDGKPCTADKDCAKTGKPCCATGKAAAAKKANCCSTMKDGKPCTADKDCAKSGKACCGKNKEAAARKAAKK